MLLRSRVGERAREQESAHALAKAYYYLQASRFVYNSADCFPVSVCVSEASGKQRQLCDKLYIQNKI